MNIFKRLFCKHEYIVEQYLFGDLRLIGKRIDICKKCGKRIIRK